MTSDSSTNRQLPNRIRQCNWAETMAWGPPNSSSAKNPPNSFLCWHRTLLTLDQWSKRGESFEVMVPDMAIFRDILLVWRLIQTCFRLNERDVLAHLPFHLFIPCENYLENVDLHCRPCPYYNCRCRNLV